MAIEINGTTGVSGVDGSAATPALQGADTNTGVRFGTDTVAIVTGGSDRVVTDASGNVGIGTSSPAERLQVQGSTATTRTKIVSELSASQFSSGIEFARSGAVAGSLIASVRDTVNGGVGFTFSTTADNAAEVSGAYSERARIDSSGNLLVGTTSQYGSSKFSVNGQIAANDGYSTKAGTGGSFTGNNFNINWTGSPQLWIDGTNLGTIQLASDYRIKRNIETQTAPALSRVMQLRPVTYQMADYGTLFKQSEGIKEGFIAHELAEVIPSAVEGEKDAEDQIQSLRLDALVSVLTKAIQEQQTLITDLTARLEALEAK